MIKFQVVFAGTKYSKCLLVVFLNECDYRRLKFLSLVASVHVNNCHQEGTDRPVVLGD